MTVRRTALITGAASGLARGVALGLASSGARVAITFRPDGTGPEETLEALRVAGSSDAVAFPADHAAAGDTASAVRAAEAALGPLDVYVHAVGPIVVKRFAGSTPQDYDAMIDGNLRSAVEGAFAVLPSMRARAYGRLIYFAMNGSHETRPAKGMSLYGAAKAGVVAFARTLALEEAALGITVNIVEPGDIRDKHVDRAGARMLGANNPTGHAGSWEDVADAVRFLVSDSASFINGMTLGVNGGLVEAHE